MRLLRNLLVLRTAIDVSCADTYSYVLYFRFVLKNSPVLRIGFGISNWNL